MGTKWFRNFIGQLFPPLKVTEDDLTTIPHPFAELLIDCAFPTCQTLLTTGAIAGPLVYLYRSHSSSRTIHEMLQWGKRYGVRGLGLGLVATPFVALTLVQRRELLHESVEGVELRAYLLRERMNVPKLHRDRSSIFWGTVGLVLGRTGFMVVGVIGGVAAAVGVNYARSRSWWPDSARVYNAHEKFEYDVDALVEKVRGRYGAASMDLLTEGRRASEQTDDESSAQAQTMRSARVADVWRQKAAH